MPACATRGHMVLRLASPWIAGVAGLSLVASVVQGVYRVDPANVLALAAASFAALVMPPFGRRVRALVKWMVAMNAALVQATINGLRGHWDVW